MLTYLKHYITVERRPVDPHGSLFHVVAGESGQWHYRVERGGHIKSSSENYSRKGGAKRAAYAAAFEVPGSRVLVDASPGRQPGHDNL